MSQKSVVEFARSVDRARVSHRQGSAVACSRMAAMLETITQGLAASHDLAAIGSVGEMVEFDDELHEAVAARAVAKWLPSFGDPVFVHSRGWRDVSGGALLERLFPSRSVVVARALVSLAHPDAIPDAAVHSLADPRVPQPGRESDYGVPEWVVAVVRKLDYLRGAAPEHLVDDLTLSVLKPWFREEK